MENTIKERMVMRVRIQDVSDRSSAIEFVGQGTWFDGKPFIVTQYKANPSIFYFFVYNEFVPEYNFFDEMNDGIDQAIWSLNPHNSIVSGTTYLYVSALDRLFIPFRPESIIENSPRFLFETR